MRFLISIDYRSGKSIYKQIADEFEQLISQGILKTDEQLPSVRQLAIELSINPNTIQKAYSELENRHLIYSVRGKGNFVAAESEDLKERKMQDFNQKLNELILEAHRNGIENKQIKKILTIYLNKEAEEYDSSR